jgi:hypothetical protein
LVESGVPNNEAMSILFVVEILVLYGIGVGVVGVDFDFAFGSIHSVGGSGRSVTDGKDVSHLVPE